MLVIRPFALKDRDSFIRLAFASRLPSLPKDEQLLGEKLQHSYDSFSHHPLAPWNQIYTFALEDNEKGTIEGISAIIARTGHQHIEYYYRLHTTYTHALKAKIPPDFQVLKAIAYAHGPTELASLYLEPQYRKGGLGRLLSLSRFLYIANRPDAFEDVIIARLMGTIRGATESPFWDGLGSHFYPVTLSEIIREVSIDKGFVHQIIPQFPIYTLFLPKEAQEVIGKPDSISQPAYNMLLSEGFSFTQDIDIIDGGPKVACPTQSIRAVKASVKATVKEVLHSFEQPEDYIISNQHSDINFRACFAGMTIQNSHHVILSAAVADALQIKVGSEIRFITRLGAPL